LQILTHIYKYLPKVLRSADWKELAHLPSTKHRFDYLRFLRKREHLQQKEVEAREANRRKRNSAENRSADLCSDESIILPVEAREDGDNREIEDHRKDNTDDDEKPNDKVEETDKNGADTWSLLLLKPKTIGILSLFFIYIHIKY
jgi:hypothetical protein